MLETFNYPDRGEWNELTMRPLREAGVMEKKIRKILLRVKENGDDAVKKLTRKYDKVRIKKLEVSQREIEAAGDMLSPELKHAIEQARQNIGRFHERQVERMQKVETMPGIICWRKAVPIEPVGLYIPGGTAPLFSSVLMLGIPAQIAGCRDILLCAPPGKDGKIHPAILYCARVCGIRNIYKAGGAQAIAAMAYGTESIRRVNKIFGPGNQFVTVAKQLVQQQGVAIDLPAGPSELLILADETAVPEFVAADLLSQAEHGADSQVILVTTSAELAKQVMISLRRQLDQLTTANVLLESLKNSRIILVKDLNEGISFSDHYSPEHLILSCAQAEKWASEVRVAGSVFIGNYSPEAAGDYATGTNHTLPTNGYARSYSGVSVDSFVKKITFQQLSYEGLASVSGTVALMAGAEGLPAHKNAVTIRINNKNGT